MGNIFIDALSGAMKDNREEGDYIDAQTGLLMCGKCHTAKQTTICIEMPGREKQMLTVPCICACTAKNLDDAKKQKEKDAAKEKIREYRQHGFYSDDHRKHTFFVDDGKDQTTRKICLAYCEKWKEMQEKNFGMMLWGDTGCGKTFYAAAVANKLIDAGTEVLMASTPDLIGKIANDWSEDKDYFMRKLSTVPLLILDDFGVERCTQYMVEQLYTLINTRYKARKPLIVTTNLSMATMKNVDDVAYKRIYERVIEMCPPIHVDSACRRKAIANERYHDFLSIVGAELKGERK